MSSFTRTSLIALLSLLVVAACDQKSNTNSLSDSLASGEPYFAIVYSQPFARRFSLPATSSVSLPSHQAAVSAEINRVNNYYTCDLHLYIDSAADIFVPSEGQYFTEKSESEHFFISSYNEKDQEWVSSMLNENSMKIRFESRDTVAPDSRFIKTLSYKRVHKNFLPGLTIASFNTYCDIFEREYYPADIWIQKSGMGDYLIGNDGFGMDKQLDKNHRFEIPVQLVEKIAPFVEIAVESNRKLRNQN